MYESVMVERVLKSIHRYNMMPAGCRVVVAVSGGADSVCLLHVLRELNATISGIAHFNHKLRGEASEEDERFVAAMAGRFGIAFFRSEARVDLAGDNLEQAGRRARRSFFQTLIRDGVCDRVALGHTRDDQAETVLFRVLRGSGLTGLAGIHPVSEGLIRPLIGVRRSQVEDFLRSRNVTWREDATNRETRFARNRIRHELMPQLAKDWNPQIVEALANLGDLAYEEEEYWSAQASRTIETCNPGRGLSAGFVEFPSGELDSGRAQARRLVRRAIAAVKGDLRGIEFQHVESVVEMKGARVSLPGVEVIRSCDRMRVVRRDLRAAVPAIEVAIPGTYSSPDGASEIRLEPCDNLELELTAPLMLRGWRPGDRYRPVGKSREQKLKKMFRTAGVPSWERSFWPILECDGKILWARQFGAAEEFAALRVSETQR
jgi:tRNA(Ile)-lysidine synthase